MPGQGVEKGAEAAAARRSPVAVRLSRPRDNDAPGADCEWSYRNRF
ncbi:hypothetical protein AVDCRST_MAG94-2554 [uncultured Leptolyngbya sp.]|uniref:Uncharacterized protein n=1 Tax=uncultured Leptolyngbya sp. TaxID=332963 RepID=A0A6J4M030_9CYAN|nr:hypothetical protein AVDCRST_MAG94-2554 [uncultured Leptolyngbya sp.]